jgi:Inhibitor of vertebrate lysozyme (Ivy)
MFRPVLPCLILLSLVVLFSTAAAEEARSGRFLHEVIAASPAHQKSLRTMLRGARSLPPWVRNMISTPRYVAGASRAVTVDGRSMELFAACLPRHCEDSRVRVLFTPEGQLVGLRIEDGKLGIVEIGDVSEMARDALSAPGF